MKSEDIFVYLLLGFIAILTFIIVGTCILHLIYLNDAIKGSERKRQAQKQDVMSLTQDEFERLARLRKNEELEMALKNEMRKRGTKI